MTDKIDYLLEKLEAIGFVADEMKEALLKHRIERITELTTEHENIAESLRAMAPQTSLPDATLFDSIISQFSGNDKTRISAVITSIRKKLRVNAYVANSFNRLIDRTLTSIASREDHTAGTYSHRGGVYARITPLLVHQKG